jgi:hypothetical protein
MPRRLRRCEADTPSAASTAARVQEHAPAASGQRRRGQPGTQGVDGRGLHSSTFQLNLSALYGIGGARRGYVARVKGVLGGG